MDLPLMRGDEDGEIRAFYNTIAANPELLKQLDDLPFAQTPLHDAAANGQARLFIELMRLMPSLTRKLNHDGFCPLHYALNVPDLILRVVHVDPELIRVKSRGGFTLLHYVAQLGNLRLLAEFLSICPESISDMTIRSETVLHIAAGKQQCDAVEVLMGWLERGFCSEVINLKQKIVNWQDDEGNTVLHIAARLNDRRLGRLILATGVADLDLIDFEGQTPLMLQTTLHRGDAQLEGLIESASCYPAHAIRPTTPLEDYLRLKMVPFERMVIHLFGRNNVKATQIKGGLLVVAVLIATATYDAGINPPGGVWSSSDDKHDAGTVIMKEHMFYAFQVFNATAFCSSMVIIFVLLPSGTILLLLQYCLVACYMLSMVIISPTKIGRYVFTALLVLISTALSSYFSRYVRFKRIFGLCIRMMAPSTTEKWQDQSEAVKEVHSRRFIWSLVFTLLATLFYGFLVFTFPIWQQLKKDLKTIQH